MSDGIREAGTSVYQRQREISTLPAVAFELDALSAALAGELRYRGLFPTPTHALAMSPAPEPMDFWVVESTAKLYVQLGTAARRRRMVIDVTFEEA